MVLRCLRAELMKCRRAPVWLAFLVLPLFPAVLGTFNYLGNLEVLDAGWYSLWTQHTLFASMFFLPAQFGVFCAWQWRLEHADHNWNAALTAPVPVRALYLGKLLLDVGVSALAMALIGLLFLLSGRLAGISAPLPPELPGWLAFGALGCTAVCAVQLYLSLAIRAFAPPVAIALVGGIFGLLLAGCHTVPNAAQETKTIAPTGYASEEVPRISLFYDGSLYFYNATGFDLPQKESWEFLGQIAFVNNLEYPTKDLNGTHLNVGQEVYRDPEFPQKLYVKYDSGFALFEAEKATKEETAEYLDYIHAEIRLATSDSLQLKLSNVSNETIIYGEAYTMEVFRDDSWEKLPVLPEDYGFIEIAYELEPGESRFMDIDFAWLYGELQKGKYKMIKEIYLPDGRVYSVPAEFEIQ